MCRLMICGKNRQKFRPRPAENSEEKKNIPQLLPFVLAFFLFASCNYTKYLTQNEYALTRNSVKVEGSKSTGFDDLIDLVRPIPNKKFMEIFPIKASLWVNHQPKFDSITGKIYDSGFNKWCRKNGEPLVLLDTSDMQRSISQIELAMFKRGYFNAKTRTEVQYLKKQKARVNYVVTPNQPYYIRSVDYKIEIPEYKRVIITDTANSLLKTGMVYDEEILVEERARIVSKIKDQGFFFVSSEVVVFLVDTTKAFAHLNSQNHPTLTITVKVSFDYVENHSIVLKSINRYRFNEVLINTNYELSTDRTANLDTVAFTNDKNKADSTLYRFVIIKKPKKKSNRTKLIKDYKTHTIIGAIWMKKGDLFSQTAFDRTYKKFRDLNNFSITNVLYHDDEKNWDSISKVGVLNTTIRLTRLHQHIVGGAFNIQTDRTGLEMNYTNRNIFRGAEYLTIKAFGNAYYYYWLNSIIKKISAENLVYGEVGGSISLRFPRLLMLPKYQNINFWSYSTDIKFIASYTQLFSRLNLQASYSYNWYPLSHISHTISPVDIATLDSRSNRNTDISTYPESYQRKFDKFFLPSARYTLTYFKPGNSDRHTLKINFSFETAGLLLYSINTLADKNVPWRVMKSFTYGTYEKFDFNLTHTRLINKNNSFATRIVFAMAIPYKKGAAIPFERSFFAGGANSMRGWSFRQLGPGGYFSQPEDYIERAGDMKIELNFEYRGPIYKAFKFCVFSDIGNIWLLTKNEDMPNSEFSFNNFYKQIAFCVGTGLRLDFNYFLIRLDYGLPIYDPSKPKGNYWINKNWKPNHWWTGTQGIQFGVNYAF